MTNAQGHALTNTTKARWNQRVLSPICRAIGITATPADIRTTTAKDAVGSDTKRRNKIGYTDTKHS